MRKTFLIFLLCALILCPFPVLAGQEEERDGQANQGENDNAHEAHDDDAEPEDYVHVGPSDVIDLGEENITEAIEKNEFIFIEFYAPWCGHCKALAPEYEKLATSLKDKIPIARVDCTQYKTTCERFDVEGFPSLKFFVGTLPVEYQGEREAESMELFLEKQLKNETEVISSKEDLQIRLKEFPVVTVGFFVSKESQEYWAFLNASRINADAEFYEIFDAEIAKSENAEPPVVFLYRDFDVTLQSNNFTDFIALSDWVTDNSVAQLSELDEVAFEILARKNPYIALFFVSDDNATRDEELAVMKTVLEVHTDIGILWTSVNDSGGLFEEVARNGSIPYIAPLILETQKFFEYPSSLKFSKETVVQYLDDVKAGKYKEILKSEAIPEEPKDGNVTVVVGFNFEEIVINSDKDVLLEIYAPWCGHCKKFAPVYDKIAYKLSNVSTLVIAKVDGVANEIPVKYEGFPTIVFFPAGNKSVENPIVHKGQREWKDVLRFLKKHATHPIKVGLGIDAILDDFLVGSPEGEYHKETLKFKEQLAKLGIDPNSDLDFGLDKLFGLDGDDRPKPHPKPPQPKPPQPKPAQPKPAQPKPSTHDHSHEGHDHAHDHEGHEHNHDHDHEGHEDDHAGHGKDEL